MHKQEQQQRLHTSTAQDEQLCCHVHSMRIMLLSSQHLNSTKQATLLSLNEILTAYCNSHRFKPIKMCSSTGIKAHLLRNGNDIF